MLIEQSCNDSPLMLDGWLEFNAATSGLRPFRKTYSPGNKQLPVAETVLYLDKKGRMRMPRGNPYIPMQFMPTPTQSSRRIMSQWQRVSQLMALDLKHIGLATAIAYPPDVMDIREWQWLNFSVTVRYTFIINLPHEEGKISKSTRQLAAKAAENSFMCERVTNMSHVFECLAGTESRKGFEHNLNLRGLELAREFLGDDSFRGYVCYAPNGEAASARIALYEHGGTAIGWVSGTKTSYLNTGAAQLLNWFTFEDLYHSGAKRFDWAGANIRSVAAAKASWGGDLVPFYMIRQPGLKYICWSMYDAWRFQRGLR